MLIAARESFAVASRKRLPYDAEVEYLQSSGAQCVDTGVYLDGALSIELSFRPLNTGVRPLGAADVRVSPALNQWLLVNASNVQSNVSVGSSSLLSVKVANAVGGDISARVAGHTLTANGSTSRDTAWTLPGEDTNVTLGLFGCHVARANNVVNWAVFATMRLYSARILDGDSVVRDFIPVRVGSGSSAVGYMYDKVSGALFGNAGAGSFVIGPDKTA